MRKLFWSVLCVTALFASCAEADIEVRPVMGGEDFTATIAETRAELDGVAVLWNDADELTIFTKTAHNRHYKVKSLSNGNRSATFGYVGFSGNDGSAIENNYAVYPYDADATLSGEVITTKINAEQVYNAEKVDLSNALMAAKSTSSALQFVNSTALMRFDVANNMPDSYTLSSIKLVSAANKIAGEATINLSTDSKAVVTENGVNEVTLSGIDTPITAEKQAFYVVLPATSFAAKDLTVTFTYAEGVEKSFALPAFDLELGSIKTIAYTINEGEDFEGSTPDSGEDFEGETPETEAKPANNEIWYTTTTNSIASISTNANEVSHEYKDGKGVIVYDADVTILVVRDYAVETISIPSTITKWDQLRFYGFNLKKLIGDNVSDDGRCLIVDGELLMFASKDLTEYTFPNNITKIGNESCSMAYSVSKFVIPEGVTAIGEYAFQERYDVDNSPILTVELPSTLQAIGSYAFRNAKIETITIPSSVNYIGHDAFTDSNNYINLLSTTPCEIGGKICGDNSIINVPESNWKSYVYSDDWCEVAHLVRINGEVPNYDSIPCFQLWYTSTNGELVDFDISKELFGSTSIISNVYQNGRGVITCAGPIREICQGAFFYEAPLFKTITLPSSIRTIGDGAFVGHDNNLTDVYCNIATPPTGGEDMFYNNNDNIGNIVTIYVPVTSIDDYKNANYWKEYNIVGYDF